MRICDEIGGSPLRVFEATAVAAAVVVDVDVEWRTFLSFASPLDRVTGWTIGFVEFRTKINTKMVDR